MAIDQKQQPATESKALAVFQEMREVLRPFPSDKYIQLVPTTLQERSDLFRPSATVVQVNADDPRDVYPTPGGGATVCLHSQALERIGNAAGIDFDPTLTRHTHDRVKEPYICEIHVGGWYVDSLGQRRLITAGAVSDLRDGTVTANVLKGGLTTARQFICERTESRARNRAIRKTTNLPSSFRKDELRKPMVAIRFRLDERDPDVRRALIDRGTGAAREVFGQTEAAALDAGVAQPDEEVIEGQARVVEDAAEPEIPDAEPAAPALDVKLIQAALEAAAKRSRVDNGKASDQQLMDIGVGLRDVLDLRNRLDLVKEERPAGYAKVRLAMLTALFGVSSSADLTARQAAALLAWLATDEGKHQARAVFGEIAAAANLPVQQTLAGAADVLGR